VVANDQVFKNLPYFRTCDSYMKKWPAD
jgi:hypothetical protein